MEGRIPAQIGIAGPIGTLDVNLQIILVIQDDIRRYSIEGMLRSLDIRLTAQSSANISEARSAQSRAAAILDGGLVSRVEGLNAQANSACRSTFGSGDRPPYAELRRPNDPLDWRLRPSVPLPRVCTY